MSLSSAARSRAFSPSLPNFLVIGAMKSGTTSLHQYLDSHPEIFMSTPKELHFFSQHFDQGLAWYQAAFAGADQATALGEASASYTIYPGADDVPKRIAETIPDARLIYLVRHPVERLRSHYLHWVGVGRERAAIDRAIFTNPAYIETSRYAARLERYLEHFPLDQILVVKSEDLLRDRRRTLATVFRFLDVDGSHWEPSLMEVEFHRASDKKVPRRTLWALRDIKQVRWVLHRVPKPVRRLGERVGFETPRLDRAELRSNLRRQLEDLFAEDVSRLRRYAGGEFDGWGIA
jgi:Sulfotransferase domain